MKQKSWFDRYLEAVEKSGDITLRWWYQKQMLKEELLSKREHDRLVHDTANEVLSRIDATVDATEIIVAIDEIQRRLDDLGE